MKVSRSFHAHTHVRECVRVRVERARHFIRHARPRKTKRKGSQCDARPCVALICETQIFLINFFCDQTQGGNVKERKGTQGYTARGRVCRFHLRSNIACCVREAAYVHRIRRCLTHTTRNVRTQVKLTVRCGLTHTTRNVRTQVKSTQRSVRSMYIRGLTHATRNVRTQVKSTVGSESILALRCVALRRAYTRRRRNATQHMV